MKKNTPKKLTNQEIDLIIHKDNKGTRINNAADDVELQTSHEISIVCPVKSIMCRLEFPIVICCTLCNTAVCEGKLQNYWTYVKIVSLINPLI